MDEDGYVWYEGRADDVIIAAGYRIGPIRSGIHLPRAPGRRRGGRGGLSGRATRERRQGVHRPHGGLRPDRRGRGVDPGARRNRLSAYHYPRRVEFVESLPKTLTGKIRRIELREAEARRAHETSRTRES